MTKQNVPKIEPTAIDQAADLVVKETWKALRDLPIFDRAFRTVHEGVLEGMLKRQIEEAARLIKVTLDV